MRKIHWKLMLAGAFVECAFGGLAVRPARTTPPSGSQAATKTTRPVVEFANPSVVRGTSTLTRTDTGVTLHLTVNGVEPGVYTGWMPIFEPGGTTPVVAGRVAGHVVGQRGKLTITAHLNEGEIISGHPVFPSGSLQDARLQDIGMVVRYHGPADPRSIYEQSHTFEPGVAFNFLMTRHNAPSRGHAGYQGRVSKARCSFLTLATIHCPYTNSNPLRVQPIPTSDS